MNDVKEIDFKLTDVYNNGIRSIYAFVIQNSGRTFLYVGITGSSNNTGISSPLARFARHIAPNGNTYSIFRGNDRLGEINESGSVRFFYTFLPELVKTFQDARQYEAQCLSYFSERKDIILLNTLVIGRRQDVHLIAPLTDLISKIEEYLRSLGLR